MPEFEIEICRGSRSGELLHDTITIEASSIEVATERCWKERPKPVPGYQACQGSERYSSDYYDVEPLWQV